MPPTLAPTSVPDRTPAQALGIGARPELVALVGGGGKTSLMVALAHSLPGRVLATTTTRIGSDQATGWPHVTLAAAGSAAEIERLLAAHGRCLVTSQPVHDKLSGVPPDLPGQWLATAVADVVIVEADGARGLPFKAPAAHEPVIPPDATLVVVLAGIDAVGGRLADVAHRPEQVAALLNERHDAAGVTADHRLTVADVAGVLVHPAGGLKGVPDGARAAVWINKVATAEQLATARRLAHALLAEPRIERVVLGATGTDAPVRAVAQRVTAVILAAGTASRMGRTKQLLPWGDTTVLGQTIRSAAASLASAVWVVTGHAAEEVAAMARSAAARPLHNPDYATGEMISSLQTAVAQLPDDVAAVVVMLADQPMVATAVVDRLIAAFWQGQGDIVAPVFEGKRGNPVLIGRRHFAELLALPPGSAPRDLLRRHPVALVPVDSDSVLRDLDDPQSYASEKPAIR